MIACATDVRDDVGTKFEHLIESLGTIRFVVQDSRLDESESKKFGVKAVRCRIASVLDCFFKGGLHIIHYVIKLMNDLLLLKKLEERRALRHLNLMRIERMSFTTDDGK